MVNISKNGCKFYSNKVTFMDNGTEVTQYTDNVSEYETLVNKFKHLSDVNAVEVVPTTEQINRLSVVNELDLSTVEGWGSEINTFVEHGFIDPNTNSLLSNISADYSVESKKCVISKLCNELASYRFGREVGGIEYNDKIATTDRESQSTVASSMMSFLSGTLTSIDYKFKNGWETFDAETFPTFAKVIGDHVSNCFAAEKAVYVNLESMSLEDLLLKDSEDKNVVDVKAMFDEEYLELSTIV